MYSTNKVISALFGVASVLVAFATVSIKFTYDAKELFTNQQLILLVLSACLAAIAAFWSIHWSRNLVSGRRDKRVFLIYARSDLDHAQELAKILREKGFHPWLDVDEILPGEVWSRSVRKAIEQSDVAIVLVSKNAANRRAVAKEIDVAMDTLQDVDKELSPIIPVIIDDTELPSRLAHIQSVNLKSKEGIDRLLVGLERLLQAK